MSGLLGENRPKWTKDPTFSIKGLNSSRQTAVCSSSAEKPTQEITNTGYQ